MRLQAATTADTQGSGLDDLEKAPAAAAHQASGGMQDAQGLRLGLGQDAVQDEQAELDQQRRDGPVGGLPALFIASEMDGLADAAVLDGAEAPSTPGFEPAGGVEVGVLTQPAPGADGPVRHPQAVPPLRQVTSGVTPEASSWRILRHCMKQILRAIIWR